MKKYADFYAVSLEINVHTVLVATSVSVSEIYDTFIRNTVFSVRLMIPSYNGYIYLNALIDGVEYLHTFM